MKAKTTVQTKAKTTAPTKAKTSPKTKQAAAGTREKPWQLKKPS